MSGDNILLRLQTFRASLEANDRRRSEEANGVGINEEDEDQWIDEVEEERRRRERCSRLDFRKIEGSSGWDLYTATKAGDLERVKFLVEETECDINRRDEFNSVPLFYACLCGHTKLVQYLLESGARFEPGRFDAERCFYAALNTETLDLLKNYKANPNKLNTFGMNMGQIAKQRLLPDAVFLVGGELGTDHEEQLHEIPIHRFILSRRSLWFRKMFRTRKEPLNDFEALHALIDFFYTAELNLSFIAIPRFLSICQECKLEGLAAIVESHPLVGESDAKRIVLKSDDHITQLLDDLRGSFVYVSTSGEEEAMNQEKEEEEDGRMRLFGSTICSDDSINFSDVCLEIRFEDEVHRVFTHKVLLCYHSAYFKSLLTGYFREANYVNGTSGGQIVAIVPLSPEEIDPDTLLLMVDYLYTNVIKQEIGEQQCINLLSASNRYLLGELKRQCISKMRQFMDSSNVFQYLELSQLFRSPQLEGSALGFIEDELADLWFTNKFITLLHQGSDEVRLELERMIDEYEENNVVEIRPSIATKWKKLQQKRNNKTMTS